MSKAFILIGMPGSGKTAAGRELASLTDSVFLDSDEVIENIYAKKSIERIFAEDGEERFREFEKMALQNIYSSIKEQSKISILATGGGMPLINGFFDELESLGTIAYLYCDCDVLAERLHNQFKGEKKERPLLNLASCGTNLIEKLHEIQEKRQETYVKARHCLDTTDLSIGEVVERLKAFF